MHILIVHHSLRIGGGHATTPSLIRHFSALGHRVDVFFFDDGRGDPVVPEGTQVSVGSIVDLVELIQRERHDIVHAYGDGWDHALDLVHLFCPESRLIVNGTSVVNPGWNSKTCASLVVISRWMADEHQAVTDLPVHLVHPSVDPAQFPFYDGPINGPPVVGWIGRASDPQKGIARIAAAAPVLGKNGIRLRIACTEPPEAIADSTIRESLLANADLWQHVSPEEMPQFYQEIAATGGCIATTSVREGFGIALLEAQSSGCPVFGFSALGVEECVSENAGGLLLPSTSSPAELAERILEALANTEQMATRRRLGRERVCQVFGPDVESNGYLGVYSQAPDQPTRELPRRDGWAFSDAVFRTRAYREWRYPNGQAKLLAAQEWRLRGNFATAAKAALEALIAAPTMFANPRRVFRLLFSSRRSATLGQVEPPRFPG